MIVEFTEDGFIYHLVQDPVTPALLEAIAANNPDRHLVVDPIRGPDHQAMSEEGQPLFDEHGRPVMEQGSIIDMAYDINDWYVADRKLVRRPVIDAPGQISLKVGEVATISLPDPCQITVDGEEHVVEGGVLELEGEMPAEYDIRVDHFPYKPVEIKVIVHEA